ncbi:hypothetical protein ACFL6I_18585 [candidate division KSB1 bacterium]
MERQEMLSFEKPGRNSAYFYQKYGVDFSYIVGVACSGSELAGHEAVKS